MPVVSAAPTEAMQAVPTVAIEFARYANRIGNILAAADVGTPRQQFDNFDSTEISISRCLDAFDAELEDLDETFQSMVNAAIAWIDIGTMMCDMDGEIGRELHKSDEMNRVAESLIWILERLEEEELEMLADHRVYDTTFGEALRALAAEAEGYGIMDNLSEAMDLLFGEEESDDEEDESK